MSPEDSGDIFSVLLILPAAEFGLPRLVSHIVVDLVASGRLLVWVALSSESPCLRSSLIAFAMNELSLSPRLDARQTNPAQHPHF